MGTLAAVTDPTAKNQSLLEERLRAQAALVARQQERIAALETENEELKQQNEDLKRRLFGRTSEKLNPQQLKLAAEAEAEDTAIAEAVPPTPPPPPPGEPPGKQRRRHTGGGRKPLPSELPVVEVIIDLPAEQKVCPQTGVALVKINEIVTEEMEWVPGHHVRKRYIRYVYAHPNKLFGPITPPLPPRLLPGSGAGAGLLAHVIIAKWVDHVPFHRQEQIAARAGVELDRHKLSRWSAEVAELMRPLYRALKAELLAGRYLQGDETPVDVLDLDRPGAARKAWLWTYYGPDNPAQAAVFEFHLSRGTESPKQFLPEDWQGVFGSDGYVVYESLQRDRPGIIPVFCWAHSRRYWVEAIKGGGQIVLDILAQIQKLYRIEREARELGLTGVKREQLRRERGAEILLDELKKQMLAAQAGALPKSRIYKAAHYALERWEGLSRYARPGFGHVLIDSNPTERNIRPVAMGRRAWLFIGSPEAGEKSAIFYSIFATCRLNKVQPEAYLRWLFPQLATATNHTVAQLLPHHFAAEAAAASP
jgi:transposase